MKQISKELDFFLNISKLQAVLSRNFESRLGGLGYSEFIVLYHLSQAKEEKLRRIDLANKVGLTASGITRLLLPMEKVGYIKREVNANDARVSYVMLAPGGKRRLEERLEDAEILAREIIPAKDGKSLEKLINLLVEIGRAMAY